MTLGKSIGPRSLRLLCGSMIFPRLKFLIRDSALMLDSTPEAYVEKLLNLEPEDLAGSVVCSILPAVRLTTPLSTSRAVPQ